MFFNLRFRAFTLAEVLITLGIIGVVAAITMPTLITNYQKHVTVSRLKKAYSQISHAFKLSEVENGETKYWNLDAPADEFAEKYLIPYLKNTEKLLTSDLNSKIGYKFLNGQSAKNIGWEWGYSLKLSDGTFVIIDGWSPGDNSYRTIYVDINGYQKPNVFGKDMFVFQILKTSAFRPYYYHSSRDGLLSNGEQKCSKQSSEYPGISCAALIMLDGWKIAPDYPW